MQRVRSCGDSFKNILQRPALAADAMHRYLAFQEQAGPARVKGGGVLDADMQQALWQIEVEAEENAGGEEMPRQLFGRVAVNRQFLRPILDVAANVALIAGSKDAAPVEDENILTERFEFGEDMTRDENAHAVGGEVFEDM